MKQKPEDFLTHHCEWVEEDQEASYSYSQVEVLPELSGKPWDDIAMVYVMSLKPVAIRVTTGCVTLDSIRDRITVFVDDNNIIDKITKEVSVYLPNGIVSGHCLGIAMKQGKESKAFRFYNREGITLLTSGLGGTSVTFEDGTVSRWDEFE